MKIKKLLLDICILLCIGTFMFSTFKIFEFQMEMRKIEQQQKEIEQLLETTPSTNEEVEESRFTPESFDKLKEVNKDYVFYLEFDSGIISLPIVQSYDNDYYLRRSFKRKSSQQGTPFVDYRNLLNDDNITMYGHYVYADASKMFTPLTKLKKQENYETNKIVRLHFRDETRTYVVAYVYEFDYTKTQYDYTIRNFASQEALDDFFAYPKKHQYYDTNVDIELGDSFITFQTCVRNQDTKRLIVVAKQIEE